MARMWWNTCGVPKRCMGFSPCFGRTDERLCATTYNSGYGFTCSELLRHHREHSQNLLLRKNLWKKVMMQGDCFGKVIPSITPTDLCTLPSRLYLVLLLFHVVSIEMCKGIFHQCSKDKHIADPEVNVQCLDGRGSWKWGSGTDHQRGHCKNSGYTCRVAWERNICANTHKYIY